MNLQLIFLHNDTKILLNEEMNQLNNELQLLIYHQNREQQILVDEQEISENLEKEYRNMSKQQNYFIDIQRTNKRILVFVVPIEFIAVHPIEWLCTCRDNGIFITELVNDVKSIEFANQLLAIFL